MYPAVPTRITIEFQPALDDSGAWTTATRVATAGPVEGPVAARPRQWMELPAAYEPSDCTCVDGLCNEDHEND